MIKQQTEPEQSTSRSPAELEQTQLTHSTMKQQNNTMPRGNSVKRNDTEKTLRLSSNPLTSYKKLKLSISPKEVTELNSLAENIAQLSLEDDHNWCGRNGITIDID